MHALDELVARWRKNPDPESTLALCAHLGAAPESDLIREVSSTAGVWHKDNHAVMLSVGRMHLEAGLLADAQAALLRAGKLSPHDATAYRYLGEVLLRRGDAIRSERALARATELGDADPDTHLWRERAIVFAALQKRQGMAAVADEVARTAPLPVPVSSRPSPHESPERDLAGGSRAARRSRPPGTGRLRPTIPKASRRRASTPPPSEGGKVSPQNTLLMGDSLRAPARAAAARAARGGTAARAAAPASGPGSTRGADSSRQPARASALEARAAEVALEEVPDVEEAAAPSDTVPDAETPVSDPFRDVFAEEHARAPDRSAASRQDFDTPFAALRAKAEEAEEAEDRLSAEAAAELAEPPPDAEPSAPLSEPRRLAPGIEAAPSPEAVLLALARVGLYETEGDVVPAWEAAPRAAPRRLWVMAAGVLAVAALGVGGYRYALGVQRERLAQAQELGMQLATALESGSRTRLGGTENDFQRLFELDSRGREPALLWLENRALHALIDAEPVTGIESALQRARTVGIEERRLVFGRLASSLVADDLPGAGATIAEWDERARDDALYQLFSGAVLERAGNPAALERYTQATRLQPDLQVAHVFAARLSLLTLGPAASKSTLEMACARLGSAPAADVLRALEWASLPSGASAAPPLPPAEALRDLPASLALVAEAVSGVRAHREGQREASKAAFERALGPTTPPALAAWIAGRALELGEVDVARKASAKAADPAAPHARAL
ncbi:MAG TPA: hypothetical protein VNN80_14595, partial [Polyangiaceae bacterium]|nr:hypothetical protein [Polyangiaceae bacterium]